MYDFIYKQKILNSFEYIMLQIVIFGFIQYVQITLIIYTNQIYMLVNMYYKNFKFDTKICINIIIKYYSENYHFFKFIFCK